MPDAGSSASRSGAASCLATRRSWEPWRCRSRGSSSSRRRSGRSDDHMTGSGLSLLGFGFVLGLRHALDVDHLAAVSTIVSERRGLWRSSLVGAVWGLGHTASLLAAGVAVIALHTEIPPR